MNAETLLDPRGAAIHQIEVHEREPRWHMLMDLRAVEAVLSKYYGPTSQLRLDIAAEIRRCTLRE